MWEANSGRIEAQEDAGEVLQSPRAEEPGGLELFQRSFPMRSVVDFLSLLCICKKKENLFRGRGTGGEDGSDEPLGHGEGDRSFFWSVSRTP